LRKRGENIILDWGVEKEIIIWKKREKQWNSSETTQNHTSQKMVMFIVSK